MFIHTATFLTLVAPALVYGAPALVSPTAPLVYQVLSPNANPPTVDVNIPAQSPAGIDTVPAVDPSYVSFAFEEVSFYAYAGTKIQPRVLSRNLIQQVTSRTGSRPYIRVGGSSLEHSSYNPNQKQPYIIPPDQQGLNSPQNVTFGPSYFNSFGPIPNALYNINIPLLKGNLANALLFAKAAYSKIGKASIEQFDVGQEPNLYAQSGNRPKSYGPGDYIAEWDKYTTTISNQLGIPLSKPTYGAVGLYGPADLRATNPAGPTWNIPNLFQEGLIDLKPRMFSVGIHYYQTSSSTTSNLQRDLMNHTAVSIKLGTYKSTIDYVRSIGLPPIFEEVASSYNGVQNNYALESVLGSCLWQIDFLLYSMSLSVFRVNYQQGLTFGYALWTPVAAEDRVPAVQVPYYGHLFAAEVIGNAFPVQVFNIDLNSDTASAYAAYNSETGALARMAILNLEFWSSKYSVSLRPLTTFVMKVPNGVTSATIKYLSSSMGATAITAETVTFGGQSWTVKSNGLPVRPAGTKDDTREVQAVAGVISVPVLASQAALVTFHY